MNCDNVINHLDEYVEGSSSVAETLAVRRHIDGCPSCASRLEELSALKKALAQLPVPAPEPGTLERLLAVAVQDPAPRARRSDPRTAWRTAGLATAAGLLLTVGFIAGIQFRGRGPADPPARLVMSATPIRVGPAAETVGLMFRTVDPLHDVSISVWLPDDVQIAGRPNVHYVSWHTDLKAGPNLLELPLQSTGPRDGGMLVVQLSQGSLLKTLEIPVAVRSSPDSPSGLL